MNENDGGIRKQEKRKEPGCDMGIPAKEGEYTTLTTKKTGYSNILLVGVIKICNYKYF